MTTLRAWSQKAVTSQLASDGVCFRNCQPENIEARPRLYRGQSCKNLIVRPKNQKCQNSAEESKMFGRRIKNADGVSAEVRTISAEVRTVSAKVADNFGKSPDKSLSCKRKSLCVERSKTKSNTLIFTRCVCLSLRPLTREGEVYS